MNTPDDTFMLFSSYGINAQDLQKWRKSGKPPISLLH